MTDIMGPLLAKLAPLAALACWVEVGGEGCLQSSRTSPSAPLLHISEKRHKRARAGALWGAGACTEGLWGGFYCSPPGKTAVVSPVVGEMVSAHVFWPTQSKGQAQAHLPPVRANNVLCAGTSICKGSKGFRSSV